MLFIFVFHPCADNFCAQSTPLCEAGGRGHLLQSDVTTPATMVRCTCIRNCATAFSIKYNATVHQVQYDPAVGRDPVSFLDTASHAAIEMIVAQFEPPASIRHLFCPPLDQPQLPKRYSLKALASAASCSGPQQRPAQEFLSKFQGLWDLVGDDFVSPTQLRQLLVQVQAPAAASRCIASISSLE